MKSMIRFSGAAIVALLLPACATVTRGTKETYLIESTPAAAEVTLSTGQTCVTPCKLKLKRKEEFTARFAKEGYQPAEAEVKSKFKGGGGVAAAGNVLIGGLVGAVVDGTNGSLMDLTPNPLRITLIPVAEAFRAPTQSVPAATPAPAIETAHRPDPAVAAPAVAASPEPVRFAAAAPAYVQPATTAASRFDQRAGESCADYAERLYPSVSGRSELRALIRKKCEHGN